MITMTEQEYEQIIANPAEARRRNRNTFQKVMKEFEPEFKKIAARKGIEGYEHRIRDAASAVVRTALGVRVTAAIHEGNADAVKQLTQKILNIITETPKQNQN